MEDRYGRAGRIKGEAETMVYGDLPDGIGMDQYENGIETVWKRIATKRVRKKGAAA
jgi:hypothetical protein